MVQQVNLATLALSSRESIAYVVVSLRGNAALRWCAFHPHSSSYINSDRPRFEALLLTCFGPTEAQDQRLARFHTMHMANHDLFTYERDFLRALAAGTPVFIAEVIPYFIAGLASAPHLQEILRQGEPNSIAAALSLVRQNLGILSPTPSLNATVLVTPSETAPSSPRPVPSEEATTSYDNDDYHSNGGLRCCPAHVWRRMGRTRRILGLSGRHWPLWGGNRQMSPHPFFLCSPSPLSLTPVDFNVGEWVISVKTVPFFFHSALVLILRTCLSCGTKYAPKGCFSRFAIS